MKEGLLTKVPVSTQELFSQLDINNSYEVYLLKYNLKQELDKQLDKYISALKHDIKTPALAQMRALELILSETQGKLDKSQKDLIRMTLESCHEQYNIINNLVTTLKFKKQMVPLTFVDLNLVELLKTNLKNLKQTISENENHIKLKTTKPEITINADEEKLSEAINKIVKYVLKRSNKGSTINLEISEDKEAKNVNIDIGETIISNVYDYKYTGLRQIYLNQESYNSVGMNLELRLIEEIINAHEGKLIQSQLGASELFNITLPKY